MEGDLLPLILLGFALGLRHGIDWDHIAAITDITASAVTSSPDEPYQTTAHQSRVGVGAASVAEMRGRWWQDARNGFLLAELYAVGHATMVVLLGVLAIWAATLLPEWLDPLMERVVGVTLLMLGVWIFYSLWRYGSSFQLRSRWMLVFALVSRGWHTLKHKLTGQADDHAHEITQYGPKTAFSIGLIHGIGAETGSQAVLLASAAGATSTFAASVLLMAFTVGLLISNSLVAAFSTFGFVSSAFKRRVYVGVGVVAGVFSLIVGLFFITGQGDELPDLQGVVNSLFGSID